MMTLLEYAADVEKDIDEIKALCDRLGIDYEVVGISEWFIDAITCYDILNCDQSQKI